MLLLNKNSPLILVIDFEYSNTLSHKIKVLLSFFHFAGRVSTYIVKINKNSIPSEEKKFVLFVVYYI